MRPLVVVEVHSLGYSITDLVDAGESHTSKELVLDGVVYSLRLRVLCGFSCLGHAYSDIVVFKQFYVLRADVLTASIRVMYQVCGFLSIETS